MTGSTAQSSGFSASPAAPAPRYYSMAPYATSLWCLKLLCLKVAAQLASATLYYLFAPRYSIYLLYLLLGTNLSFAHVCSRMLI